MNLQQARHALESLADMPGLFAVALLDAGSGLLLHSTANEPLEPALWEAAVDYWQLHGRRAGCFDALGPLQAAVMYHRQRMLCVLPWPGSEDLLVVCVAGHGLVDWRLWQLRLRQHAASLQG